MGSPLPSPAALLFDLDGTLIFSDPLHRVVFAEVLAPWGVDVTEDVYARHIHGRLNADIFADLAPGGDPVALGDAKEAEFRRRLGGQADPVPGAPAFLARAAAAGIPCAVVTNAPRANAVAMLSAIGLAHRFPVVVAEGDAAAAKPDPAPYRLGAARLGVDPAACVVFEDSPAGIRACGHRLYRRTAGRDHRPPRLTRERSHPRDPHRDRIEVEDRRHRL
ncbi:MAG: HAD family phosphatase [Rhodobacteraceae bacterium]|nr:HAD family phosphatase [Paracoccaceae bacterium]